MDGHDRREVLLAAERAASLRLGDDSLCVAQCQCALQGGVDVVGALHRARDGDPAVRPRLRDHGLVLDVQLLLVADAILAFDDEASFPKGRFRIAAGDPIGRELLCRLQRVEDGRQWLRAWLDTSLGLAERGLVRCRDQRDRFRVVPDLAVREGRHVVLDRADDVLAGDVCSRHDDDLGPVEIGIQVQA